MRGSRLAVAFALGVIAWGGTDAYAAPILLDFGSAVVADNNNSPAHQADPARVTGTTWNLISTADKASPNILDMNGAATTVGVDVGVESPTNIINWATTTGLGAQTGYTSGNGPGLNTGVYAGDGRSFTFNNNGEIGVRISGLSAGSYDFYAAGRNTNNTSTTQSFKWYYATRATGTADFDYSTGVPSLSMTNLTDGSNGTWVSGNHYVTGSVTLTTGQDLILVVQGTGSEARGFINLIEIVPTPEPSSALTLCGLASLLLRRRR